MILIDTNVISEVMRPAPSKQALQWLNDQNAIDLCISSISIAEIGYGLRILPDGQRRRDLHARFEAFVTQAFSQRVFDFTEAAAKMYAEIMGYRKEIGRPMSLPDGQIASIARCNHLTLATRNITDFEVCGVTLINPFEK